MPEPLWKLLIVDDQTSVVQGLLVGVDWNRLGIGRVFSAYNAHEARQILLEQPVDIMLCDIQMPVENGLSLVQWMREQGMDTLCVFITAYAEFSYASAAVRLDGFEYILKPFSYAEIEAVLARAVHKCAGRASPEQADTFAQQQLANDVLRGWFTRSDIVGENLLSGLRRLGAYLEPKRRVFVAWLQMCRQPGDPFVSSAQPHEELGKLLQENFVHYAQKVLLSHLSRYSIGCVFCPDGEFEMDVQGVQRQLEKTLDAFRDISKLESVCFFIPAFADQSIADTIQAIEEAVRCHATQGQEVIPVGIKPLSPQTFQLPDMHAWGSALLENSYEDVMKEAIATIREHSRLGMLSSEWLQRFYQNFVQMISLVLEQKGLTMSQLFVSNDELQISRNALENADGLIGYVQYLLRQIEAHSDERVYEGNQVRQGIRYIHNHLEQNIRRDDVARTVFLHPNYLSRIFREETGIPLKEFIIQEKMNLAQQLLQQTQLPVSIIAQRVGYQNFSHFSQAYKKAKGKNPTEERRQE